MTLTEEQREAIRVISKLPMAIGCQLCHPYIMKNYGSHFIVLRAMTDSSENAREPPKMVGFDLEKVKADLGDIGDPRFCDCEVRTQLAAAIAEIERLLADLEQSERCIEARLDVIDQQAAQIKELEAQVINWTETAREYATNSDYWQDRARKAEGKISIGDHIVGPDQMVPNGKVWQITEERVEALQDAVNRYDVYDRCLVTHDRKVHVLGVLRAMLTEAEQCE